MFQRVMVVVMVVAIDRLGGVYQYVDGFVFGPFRAEDGWEARLVGSHHVRIVCQWAVFACVCLCIFVLHIHGFCISILFAAANLFLCWDADATWFFC